MGLARRERRWTARQLAERVGVSEVTMRKVERGDVACGSASPSRRGRPRHLWKRIVYRALEASRVGDRLALLPKSVHEKRREVDDDYRPQEAFVWVWLPGATDQWSPVASTRR